MISRSQMYRQLYSNWRRSAIKGSNAGNGREGFSKPIPGSRMQNSPLARVYLEDLEVIRNLCTLEFQILNYSLSNVWKKELENPSFNSFGGTNDSGFGSPMGGVYSGSMGGELPNEQRRPGSYIDFDRGPSPRFGEPSPLGGTIGNIGEFGPEQYYEQTGQLPPGYDCR
jgi:hypothetical protein